MEEVKDTKNSGIGVDEYGQITEMLQRQQQTIEAVVLMMGEMKASIEEIRAKTEGMDAKLNDDREEDEELARKIDTTYKRVHTLLTTSDFNETTKDVVRIMGKASNEIKTLTAKQIQGAIDIIGEVVFAIETRTTQRIDGAVDKMERAEDRLAAKIENIF